MSKKEKPVKVAKGKYTYRGYKLHCNGAYGAGKEVEWVAVCEETDSEVCRAASLHELVRVMDETIKG